MKVDYPDYAIHNIISKSYSCITWAIECGKSAEVKPELMTLYSRVYSTIEQLDKIIKVNNFSTEYINLLSRNLDKLNNAFPTDYGTDSADKRVLLVKEDKSIFKRQQESQEAEIIEAYARFQQTFDFFSKIQFLNKNLVIIGANGSGKTFLANNLKEHIKSNGIIVSAQRFLLLPEIQNIKSLAITAHDLKNVQTADKDIKKLDVAALQKEFEALIQNMLAEDLAAKKEYSRKAHQNTNEGLPIEVPVLSNLERMINLWNSVFISPKILQEDDINIKAFVGSGTSYPVAEMSEGEKVVLFLIAHVLQSPDNGFIVIDEPEMHLHPIIHRKLWDKLEEERPDSKFIYLTHDLDFASSRINAKKLWLRSFVFPDQFNLEDIPPNEIPEPLLLELLGSRQNILFCEGSDNSLDAKIYRILFPECVIKPVGGCFQVMAFTKAFNKLENTTTKSVGIIDADYHSPERLTSLQVSRVFGLQVAEVENLLLAPEVLAAVCCDLETVAKIKKLVLRQLQAECDLQVAHFVSTKVDNYFKDSNVSRANDLASLRANYATFEKQIDIDHWFTSRIKEIEGIVTRNDYDQALRIFNNKGLNAKVSTLLGIKNFSTLALAKLETDKELRKKLRRYFPNF